MANTIKLFHAAEAEEVERFESQPASVDMIYTQNIIDFSKLDQYGLIDRAGQSIVPKISNDVLASLADMQTYGINIVDGSVQVLDFVADAYTDMVSYLQSVRFRAGDSSPDTYENKNGSTRDTFVENLTATSGYVSPVSLHKQHVNTIYDHFIRVYLEDKGRHKNINNHHDFLKMFVNYIFSDFYTDIANINISSHMKRSLIPIDCSGLVIKISDLDVDDQAYIDELYYGDPNFNLYASTADKFGFYIDEKRPYMLVANLSSKKMNEYAQNRGSFLVKDTSDSGFTGPGGLGHTHEYEVDAYGNGKTTHTSAGPYHEHIIENYCVKHAQKGASHKHELPRQDVFTKYYVRAHEGELDRLKSLLHKMYDSYIKQNPQNIINTFPKGLLVKKAMLRPSVTEKEFFLALSDEKWIRLYFDLKINEERVILKRNKYLKIVRQAQKMLTTATTQEVVNYINKEINSRLYGLLYGPNMKKEYHDLPGSNTLKKLSENF
tara:strand:+ start:11950 stop:13425 length:1476 start_codon:yes stop_codon:yes gene_type:complete